MTVHDIMYLFLDSDLQRVRLYDLSRHYTNAENPIIFDGFLSDMPRIYERLEVLSIDNLTGTTLTLNVDIAE